MRQKLMPSAFKVAFISLAFMALPAAARADILPDGAKIVSHTFEIENLNSFPGAKVIAYRTDCHFSNDKDFADMNPHLAHIADYELLEASEVYSAPKFCTESKLYALTGASWSPVRHDGPTGGGLGWARSHYTTVKEIDLLKTYERQDILAKKATAAPFVLAYVTLVGTASPLKAIHETLRIETLTATEFRIRPSRIAFTYDDGSKETKAANSTLRPRPSKAMALTAPSHTKIDLSSWAPEGDVRDAIDEEKKAEPAPSKSTPYRMIFVSLATVGSFATWAARRKRLASPKRQGN